MKYYISFIYDNGHKMLNSGIELDIPDGIRGSQDLFCIGQTISSYMKRNGQDVYGMSILSWTKFDSDEKKPVVRSGKRYKFSRK